MEVTNHLPPRWGRTVTMFLVALVACDLGFVLLHIANKLVPWSDARFDLTYERGHPEAFQHLKEAGVSMLLFVLAWRARVALHAAWALLFLYLLLDDALQVHERVGGRIALRAGFVSAMRLRAQDFGELAVSLAVGSLFFALIASLYRRAPGSARAATHGLAVLLAALVFFGIVIDLAHIAVPIVGFSMVEDGGEMLVMSALLAYALHLVRGARA
jgi:hypothetical protein